MIPREHFPLAITALVLAGLLFLVYREVSSLKTAVARISVDISTPAPDALPIEFFDSDADTEPIEEPIEVIEKPKSILKTSASKASRKTAEESAVTK
jgi:hypothetical protein